MAGETTDKRKRRLEGLTSEANHPWPSDPDEHLWGPWMSQSRSTQYRVCVHPLCREVDERQAPLS